MRALTALGIHHFQTKYTLQPNARARDRGKAAWQLRSDGTSGLAATLSPWVLGALDSLPSPPIPPLPGQIA